MNETHTDELKAENHKVKEKMQDISIHKFLLSVSTHKKIASKSFYYFIGNITNRHVITSPVNNPPQ